MSFLIELWTEDPQSWFSGDETIKTPLVNNRSMSREPINSVDNLIKMGNLENLFVY